ncbi:hypothetical protein B0H10DRAFT_1972760 [Mycena sp. CBHHK59/15]|nr:hypothetical protein B0H10DRAFT_1972760 [Mycena sp. CBHHK59/15]
MDSMLQLLYFFPLFSAASHIPTSQASEHGNADAAEHLCALSQASLQGLSHIEHNTITENKLVRKHMQAKQRSDATFEATHRSSHLCTVMELMCKSSLADMEHYRQGSMGAAAFNYHTGYGSLLPTHTNMNRVPNGTSRRRMLPVAEHQHNNSLLPTQHLQLARDNTLPAVQQHLPQARQGRMLLGAWSKDVDLIPDGTVCTLCCWHVRGACCCRHRHRGSTHCPTMGCTWGLRCLQQVGWGGTTNTVMVNSPPASGGGLATFAEMGFTGAKAEDKECVIM